MGVKSLMGGRCSGQFKVDLIKWEICHIFGPLAGQFLANSDFKSIMIEIVL